MDFGKTIENSQLWFNQTRVYKKTYVLFKSMSGVLRIKYLQQQKLFHTDFKEYQMHILQLQITTNKMLRFLIYLFLQTLYMFQAVPPPIIRST
jgi:hypothetical protein